MRRTVRSHLHVGDDLIADTSTFDRVEGRIETERLVVRDEQVRRSDRSIRLPAITELREWLHSAGFSAVAFQARDGQRPSDRLHRP